MLSCIQTTINKAEVASDPKLTYFVGGKDNSKLFYQSAASTAYDCDMLSCTFAFSYSDTIYLSFEVDYSIHHLTSLSQF